MRKWVTQWYTKIFNQKAKRLKSWITQTMRLRFCWWLWPGHWNFTCGYETAKGTLNHKYFYCELPLCNPHLYLDVYELSGEMGHLNLNRYTEYFFLLPFEIINFLKTKSSLFEPRLDSSCLPCDLFVWLEIKERFYQCWPSAVNKIYPYL